MNAKFDPRAADPISRKALRVLLPTLGSAGDIHPMIALGLALQQRGHSVTVIASPVFQPTIENAGLKLLPVGTLEEAHALLTDPQAFDPWKGFDVVAKRLIVPAIAEIFRIIEKNADADTVVAASTLSLGARIAQDKLGIPTATVHLQPSLIRSLIDGGMVGYLRISASKPIWFKRAFFGLLDWAVIDRCLQGPVNEFRKTLGLPPVTGILRRWVHSPQCVVGFFPEWFAATQPDWPPQTHLVGFPLWDGSGGQALVPPEAEDFLRAGDPPIIFTPGTAGSRMHRYFSESAQAVRGLGLRAMFVTNYPEQLPRDLPSGVKPFGYMPFSEVLPRAALLVYHGGIGTLAQAINAGSPHLVVPNAFDQFDSGMRIERLGLGRSIWQTNYRADRAAKAIRAILDDKALRQRCVECAQRLDSSAALARACTLVEGLPAKSVLS